MELLEDKKCLAGSVINTLKGKFALEILSAILDGHLHYGYLIRNIDGINPRILATRLRAFEEEGILSRKVLPLIPPQVEYRLTDKGMALYPIIEAMRDWHLEYN
ncbi:winged helix-turn-helix transcriptional regulator [Lactococcus termiticola]|uniref:MarR family transcriptional regulator n=1 Tax=Lactococcus termiticola TaxID=2169526 RepID=A0A2R5HFR7_9LACT|nr:helix-turn-helix domain-containing protein [Lactococcus termiticola]GBG96899.1 MarR family transcriptional regulator [Lactococcus termiticola]